MKFEVKLAVMADAEAICILNRDELGYDYQLEKTKEKLLNLLSSKTDKIFAAAVGGRVIGYIHASDYDVIYAPHMKNIMGIAVAEEYRHNGIGASLIQAIEDWAKETGACGVRLCSGESRTGAHGFYRHCGYSCDKRQLNFKKIFKEDKNDK